MERKINPGFIYKIFYTAPSTGFSDNADVNKLNALMIST
jgi:hypothetical protein